MAVKKLASKKIVKKVEKKCEYIPEIRVSGYDIEIEVENANNDGRWGNDYLFRFAASLDGVPHCCGLQELGSFDYEATKNILIATQVEWIRTAFEKLVKIHTNQTKTKCITIIFTLINQPVSSLIREALKDEKLFKKVKTFVNKNSNNKNELYMSVN